ncbi:hypothetical protein [Streptomyces sp. NPDC001594]|uniref:hypothetical protein n=1 Tax=Streptomyces sp. NPDC001594 TaxID=3364590 RepID=UPI003679C3D4
MPNDTYGPAGIPDEATIARVQGEMSRLLTEDSEFRDAFAVVCEECQSFFVWRDSGFSESCPSGTVFLKEFLEPDNAWFWKLWDMGFDDAQMRFHLGNPDTIAQLFPAPRVTRRGFLQDVQGVDVGPSPRKPGGRNSGVPRETPALRNLTRNRRPVYQDLCHFMAPQVTRGEGPGRLGAEGTAVLGPGLAVEPHTLSRPSNHLTTALNNHDRLGTYGWVAGHIINAEWSTGNDCTVLTGLANGKHKNDFEGPVRKALALLRICYGSLHECGVDTRQLQFGIFVRVRVSETSWGHVHEGFDTEETRALCRLIPFRITCSAQLVGRPVPEQVRAVSGEYTRSYATYLRSLHDLEAAMAGLDHVEIQNERAHDAESEIAAGRERKKRKLEAQQQGQRKRARSDAVKKEILTRFRTLADRSFPGRAPHDTKVKLSAAYGDLRPQVLAEHFREAELAVMRAYFQR